MRGALSDSDAEAATVADTVCFFVTVGGGVSVSETVVVRVRVRSTVPVIDKVRSAEAECEGVREAVRCTVGVPSLSDTDADLDALRDRVCSDDNDSDAVRALDGVVVLVRVRVRPRVSETVSV